MKRCKCISTKFFDEIEGEDYGINVGDIRHYQFSDMFDTEEYPNQQLIEIRHNNKTLVYMFEKKFKETFIDLTEYRKIKIRKLLENEYEI